MDDFSTFAHTDDDWERIMGATSKRENYIQIAISLSLGIVAFLTFCTLRPRWPGLYAARQKHKNAATILPELPDTFFGWIKPLWKITDQEVLASAGLDAYAFLAFFKMAMKFCSVLLFFSLIIIKPVHDAHPEEPGGEQNKTRHHGHGGSDRLLPRGAIRLNYYNGTVPFLPEDFETDYLWMYVVLAYLFSAIAIYLVVSETRKLIEVRQEYLGTRSSVTDRTIRLSGIPIDLRDEEKIKEFIESLDIGKVESVTLCMKWRELDKAMVDRMDTLRRLEEALVIYQGYRTVERNLESLPLSQPPPPHPLPRNAEDADQDESARLINTNEQPHLVPYERPRPTVALRYGWMKLRSKSVDAIDYYEEKLRQADEQIKELRQKKFEPTPLAFVTMNSVAACQMAIQAVLDPSPLELIANQSPAPADVIWPNTYLSRRNRMFRAWSITALIVLLTVFWSAIFVPIAGLLNTDTIGSVFPQVADVLKEHPNVRSLVNAQLPTLMASLLMVLAPYLYYYLSWCQGMISQGDVELSTISKNFFFTFFNFFVIFTVLGTASKFYQFFDRFGDTLKDFRNLAYTLALSLQRLLEFYVNFIILQGLGLFPFRLLEAGAVSLYPIWRMGAKTPRDYAELVQPPMFSYGFYLPNALLIFIICTVYSVLRDSWKIMLAGLVYFSFGRFVYKYQLLYAMDHQQQATGRAWGMICDRVFVGLIFFQLTTAGQLLLKQAVTRSVLMVPLIVATAWASILYGRTYKPLMQFIALRSVKRGEPFADPDTPPGGPSVSSSTTDLAPERNVWADDQVPHQRHHAETRTRVGKYADESNTTGLRFVNPSLIAPLERVWIADKHLTEPMEEEVPVNGEEAV